MQPSKLRPLPALVSAFLFLFAACEDNPSNPAPPLEGQAPDFSLTDVNPNSPSSGKAVSPRQRLGEISAWYFGQAT